MVKPIRKTSSKNPPIFSHEFVIQNHADIVSFIAMLIVVGLIFQATSPIASLFITLQHNVTEPSIAEPMLYMPGVLDLCAIFFYSLICIVIHAIIQEYVLDKVTKRFHLSKSKLSIFSTSGQYATYYLVTAIWGLDILIREGYILHPTLLWSDYPAPLSSHHKMLLLIQLAYSIHELPELYLQRTPRAQVLGKAAESIGALIFVAALYVFSFNRLLLCLLVLHYISELIHHATLLVQTVDKEEKLSKVSSLVSNVALVLARLGSIMLAVLTLWSGLALLPPTDKPGDFNTGPIRLGTFIAICLLQCYLMYNFITQQLAKARETNASVAKPSATTKSNKKNKDKKKAKRGSVEESDLPEVDQNTNKNIRSKTPKVKN